MRPRSPRPCLGNSLPPEVKGREFGARCHASMTPARERPQRRSLSGFVAAQGAGSGLLDARARRTDGRARKENHVWGVRLDRHTSTTMALPVSISLTGGTPITLDARSCNAPRVPAGQDPPR